MKPIFRQVSNFILQSDDDGETDSAYKLFCSTSHQRPTLDITDPDLSDSDESSGISSNEFNLEDGTTQRCKILVLMAQMFVLNCAVNTSQSLMQCFSEEMSACSVVCTLHPDSAMYLGSSVGKIPVWLARVISLTL